MLEPDIEAAIRRAASPAILAVIAKTLNEAADIVHADPMTAEAKLRQLAVQATGGGQ